MSAAESQMIRSTSSLTCNEYQQSSNHSQSQQPTSVPPSSASPSQYSVSVQNSPKYQSNNRSAVNPNSSQTQNGSSANSNVTTTVSSNTNKPAKSSNYSPVYVHNKTTSFINNLPNNSNSRLELELLNETVLNSFAARVDRNNEIDRRNSSSTSNSNSNSNPALQFLTNDLSSRRQIQHNTQPRHNKKGIISNENSLDSETSQGDEHNFSELLNLSVCAPSSIINMDINNPLSGIGEYDATGHNMAELQQSYSIANSVTVSDISSLANLGTPDSPPRATSPTIEIRELLDKIQQLPQQKSPAMDCSFTTPAPSTSENQQSKSSRFFKNKSKTLYMPLNTTSTNKHHPYFTGKISPGTAKHSGNIFSNSGIFSYAGKTTKGWLSRSAPATPCGNFVPIFPSSRERKSVVPKSHMGSKSKMDDASALLTEFDGSDGDDEQHNNRNEQL